MSLVADCLNLFKKLQSRLAADADCNQMYTWFHRGLAVVYLFAFVPLFFQIDALIGHNGLLPANTLLHTSYNHQGVVASFIQFPSLFHFYPSDYTLFALLILGCAGALLVLFEVHIFAGSIMAWVAFLSITTIGGDFFIIIIDLFLAEVGFLAIFSTYFLRYHGAIPTLLDFVFRLLNFRLWFCMGVNKFYLPKEVWRNFTFFNYFFQAQPMPTPMAYYFHYLPAYTKWIAEIFLLIGEVIVPFFVFGGRRLRLLAFATFFIISALIELTGNYGFFNVLSVVVAFTLLKRGDIPFLKTNLLPPVAIRIPQGIKVIMAVLVAFQLMYCVSVFDTKPYSPQNHFNYVFNNLKPTNQALNKIIEPLRWVGYWRLCNPYGVFKGIPHYHGELRFSGSADSTNWAYYRFKFVPSTLNKSLAYFAPTYPRLDHLMFYETLSDGSYKHNPLNPYAILQKPWMCTFINKLLTNDSDVLKLLAANPFQNKAAPVYIKAEAYRLQFAPLGSGHVWQETATGISKVYTAASADTCSTTIITGKEAMSIIF